MRLSGDTPARRALAEVLKKVRHPRGQRRLTWVTLVNRDLAALGLGPINSLQTYRPPKLETDREEECARPIKA